MSSYRFCRTDDIALLTDAWNRCGVPHDEVASPLTVETFKREIRELDLWCSSCMVAFDGADPVGVLIGCKRPPYTLVRRLAVHPEQMRKGHGRHLLTSLSAKLAILGPPHLLSEIPSRQVSARALFAACGWREQSTTVDLALAAPARPAAGIVQEATFEEVADTLLPPADAPRSWERTRATLTARAPRLRGLVLSAEERLDASLLYTREDEDRVAVWAIAYERDDAGEAAVPALLGDLERRERAHAVLPRVADDEIDPEIRARLGLTVIGESAIFRSDAKTA